MDRIQPDFVIKRRSDDDKVIALAGNPNVGKSTVFNALTGLNQHTGNWAGKTVTNTQGYCQYKNFGYVIVDLPGCYSLMARSAEEEAARNFICFEEPDAVVVICDATCLERNLNLVLQSLEITSNVIVCVNLMDEAKKKKIHINIDLLSSMLNVPVIEMTARNKQGLDLLMENVCGVLEGTLTCKGVKTVYPDYIERAVSTILMRMGGSRWAALRILEKDRKLIPLLYKHGQIGVENMESLNSELSNINDYLYENRITEQRLRDDIVRTLIQKAEKLCSKSVTFENKEYYLRDEKIDKLLTSKRVGFPVMIFVLMVIFWITISGANIPSQRISELLFWIEEYLFEFFMWFPLPRVLCEMLVFGMYRVLAWVVSVMLPPMAIFFPLFTLLEDSGYLPRIAFNLDKVYKKCCTCGKQALTMMMGFGCNAVGVTGCRIIDSPRERMIAIITNNLVPCNGRLPALISITAMFFVGVSGGIYQSFLSAMVLTGIISLGVAMTFLISRILSKTLLKGMPSSFALELPPYRRPQWGRIILHSIFERTLFLLRRAMKVAAPAGIVIWLMANVTVGDISILIHFSELLDPFAKMLGMDGVILLAFILGWPANEIVMPIIIMTYMSKGSILELDSLDVLKKLLVDNGWTWATAVSVAMFSLMHWPCSTTCMTILKETKSVKWTLASIIIPTILGVLMCLLFTSVLRISI